MFIFLLCVIDIHLVSSIFFNDSHIEKDFPVVDELKQDKEFSKRQDALEHKQNDEWVCTMYFDGSIGKEGAGTGIWIIFPNRYFKCTLLN